MGTLVLLYYFVGSLVLLSELCKRSYRDKIHRYCKGF